MGASEAVHVSAVLCFCIFLSMSWQVFRVFSKGFRRVFRGFTGAETNARRHRVCRKTDRLSCFFSALFLYIFRHVVAGFQGVFERFPEGFQGVFGGFSGGFQGVFGT